MTTTDPLTQFGTKRTIQTQRVPGRPEQVQNNQGGFVFETTADAQLRRFLTMGTAGGTYYVGEGALTRESGELVIKLTEDVQTHKSMVDTIVEISVAGRAPKPNPALFALAIACQLGETEGKQYARKQINEVVRTGTHLFTFVGYLNQFGGWSRGLRKAVGNWYAEKDVDKLALQLIKYRSRAGYTHRDVLRLSHPKVEGPGQRAAIDWAVKGNKEERENLPDFIKFFEMAQVEGADIPGLLDVAYLPWEALPDSAMNDVKVWAKLLGNGMPITALVRQLPRLTNLGLLPVMGGGETATVVGTLLNPDAVRKSRIHPFQVLVALKTYASGRGERNYWTPSPKVIDALDEMFYMSFANVVPTNKRTMSAIDISSSMQSYAAGKLPLTCREVAAALAMVTVQTEPQQMTVGFSTMTGYNTRDPRDSKIVDLPLSKRQRLDDVVRSISGLPFGGTDCALPMVEALHRGLEIDTFVVYTDNETGHGRIHPFQALQQYRKTMGIDAKLIVVSVTPSRFTIADPRDPGMLDISGFDAAVPTLIADFSRGDI